MTDVTVLPRRADWTVADLADIPDDGLRYELVDGTLLVSPAPSKRHQRCVGRLHLLLVSVCPPELEVFLAPMDYQPTQVRSLQPDLLVVARDDPGEQAVTTPLALVVEVMSPSSRSVDLVLKRELYEQSRAAAYWVVDPAARSVSAWTLRDGHYGDPQVVTARDAVELAEPFPVRLAPGDLLA